MNQDDLPGVFLQKINMSDEVEKSICSFRSAKISHCRGVI